MLTDAPPPTESCAEPESESERLQRLHTWVVAPQSFSANMDWLEYAGLLAAVPQPDHLFEG